MPSMIKDREPGSTGRESSQGVRVLVMSEDGMDLGTSKELLRLPGYRVQTCSSYVEMLLHLEHESFQLVIIFEGKKSSPEWQAEIQQVAETSRGALVLVFKRSEEVTNLPGVLAS